MTKTGRILALHLGGLYNKEIAEILDYDVEYVAKVVYIYRKRSGIKIGRGNGKRIDGRNKEGTNGTDPAKDTLS